MLNTIGLPLFSLLKLSKPNSNIIIGLSWRVGSGLSVVHMCTFSYFLPSMTLHKVFLPLLSLFFYILPFYSLSLDSFQLWMWLWTYNSFIFIFITFSCSLIFLFLKKLAHFLSHKLTSSLLFYFPSLNSFHTHFLLILSFIATLKLWIFY